MSKLPFWKRQKALSKHGHEIPPIPPTTKFASMYSLLRDAESYSVSGDEETCKNILTILLKKIEDYNAVDS